jgi:hypothetical protein
MSLVTLRKIRRTTHQSRRILLCVGLCAATS